jgi:hypothetical protein
MDLQVLVISCSIKKEKVFLDVAAQCQVSACDIVSCKYMGVLQYCLLLAVAPIPMTAIGDMNYSVCRCARCEELGCFLGLSEVPSLLLWVLLPAAAAGYVLCCCCCCGCYWILLLLWAL